MREERLEETQTSATDGLINGRRYRSPRQLSPSHQYRFDDGTPKEDDEPKVFQLKPDEGAPAPSMVARLMERKVAQWFIAYLAVAFILLQLTEILAPMWSLPLPIQRGISVALGLGTVPALVVAWYHGEMGRQRVCWAEVGIIGAAMLGTAAAVWRVCLT